ncbi:hypothetical protein [Hydromonas duriensis]|uniref:Uncharacterized protein n=1 Tax=Hydromonas duriensis TaxID=1527608 RepID=A0A4R6XZV1_9BURK|nr:hypothetical protein [Hydromonas duriensis]TDR27014.1 hypothetical protein DFR44_1562 [Hydromonas duriensis]
MKTISKKIIFTIGLVVIVLLSCQQLLANKKVEVKLLENNRIKFVTYGEAWERGFEISDIDYQPSHEGGAITSRKLPNEVTNTLKVENSNVKNKTPVFSMGSSKREIIMSDANVLLKNRVYLVFAVTGPVPESYVFCIKNDAEIIVENDSYDSFIKRCHKESLP